MAESLALAEQFEQQRSRLRGVAYRMLGSLPEAEDAVQEAWLRLNRSDAAAIENLGGWLTTVVARVCLDQLRSRKSRREESLDVPGAAASAPLRVAGNPEQEAMLAESVGLALLVVLDRLAPAERIAFVLHDMFGLDFETLAAILERTPAATRQLASRARRRVQGASSGGSLRMPRAGRASLAAGRSRASERSAGAAGEKGGLAALPGAALREQREAVSAFIAALRAGDVEGIVAVLDPDVVVHFDGGAGGPAREIRGARNWAQGAVAYSQRLRGVAPVLALVDGAPGLIAAPGGRLQRALKVTMAGGRIAQVDIVADPARLRALTIAPLEP